MAHNKQLERTVIRRRWTAQRAATHLRRYATAIIRPRTRAACPTNAVSLWSKAW